MYYEHFHLKEHPFRLTSDLRFYYASPEHAHTLAMMEFCQIKKQGLMILTGNSGTGKSMLLQQFLSRLDKSFEIILLPHTAQDETEYLQTFAGLLGIDNSTTSKQSLMNKISQTLLSAGVSGRKIVIIIDDAHKLENTVITDMAALSQLQNEKVPVCSFYLVGANSLQDTIDRLSDSDVLQNNYCKHKLGELGGKEIKNYIMHRLMIAGGHKAIRFDEEIFALIEAYTGGSPKKVNVLMDHMLTSAYLAETDLLDGKIVETAVNELQWVPHGLDTVNNTSLQTDSAFLTERRQSYKLIINLNKENQSEFFIRKKRINIGRHRSNDVSIDDSLISRVHAQIIRQGRIFYIRDMNSKNGIFIDEKRVDIARLKDNMKIRIGNCMITFIRQGKADPRHSVL